MFYDSYSSDHRKSFEILLNKITVIKLPSSITNKRQQIKRKIHNFLLLSQYSALLLFFSHPLTAIPKLIARSHALYYTHSHMLFTSYFLNLFVFNFFIPFNNCLCIYWIFMLIKKQFPTRVAHSLIHSLPLMADNWKSALVTAPCTVLTKMQAHSHTPTHAHSFNTSVSCAHSAALSAGSDY